ncbi:AraC family transcriptional regulator [Nocardioides sp. SYSU DS0651]|uniref:helix-turn-helix transcriptional regulator n=1 Tax=Nocardioides sp. SYSU DS0651 TaxID=3415955 RepID=UPI003F4C2C2E
MSREAYAFVRDFAVAPTTQLLVDRHYLLCASRGALRLEAAGRSWLLPPARAALIAAGEPIQVAIPQPSTTSSVLFATDFTDVPPAPLTVFDLNPLARALVSESIAWPDDSEPLPAYARSIFAALAAVAWRLAEHPSQVHVPAGRSPELRRALAVTAERSAEDLSFSEVAAAVGLTPRSLARRFEEECAMTWRAVLRRMRVLRAVEELAAGQESITTVAHRVGYTSLSAFNAAFRDLTGRTPTEYRATFR